MKTLVILIIACAVLVQPACPQGFFTPGNPGALTHVGSADGTLAGANVLAQFLAGISTTSLTPVGLPLAHNSGFAAGPRVMVPGVPADNFAYVQMWAWDSTQWGTDFAGVPGEQFGRSDVVTVLLTSGQPTFLPQFNQPTIVPIPEPSVWTLWVVGAGMFFFTARRHRQA